MSKLIGAQGTGYTLQFGALTVDRFPVDPSCSMVGNSAVTRVGA